MAPAVEVLVVSYASAPVIERLLASLRAVLPDAPVAIREHAADPDALAALVRLGEAHSSTVRIEHDPTNPGFGAGCNALAAGSESEFVVFLNPDTELVTWPWSGADLPRATIVGPEMTEDAAAHYGRSFRIRDEIALSWLRRSPKRPDGTGYVSGAALLIERQAFDRIGGFDPAYFLFYEDLDLCRRANAAGIATRVDPRWTMHHARHHSTGAQLDRALHWSYESAVQFHRSNGSSVIAYRAYTVVDSTMRSLLAIVRRRRVTAHAYAGLARRALTG